VNDAKIIIASRRELPPRQNVTSKDDCNYWLFQLMKEYQSIEVMSMPALRVPQN
jgi:hypothetical protein